jgi:predicted membrane GTPase involved in stress response
MAAQIVIVNYKAKEGKDAELMGCIKDHMDVLRKEGLATHRPAVVMRATDGSLLELFEWVSAEAVEKAHTNPAVGELWKRFSECCTINKLADLAEAKDMFATFEPVHPKVAARV